MGQSVTQETTHVYNLTDEDVKVVIIDANQWTTEKVIPAKEYLAAWSQLMFTGNLIVGKTNKKNFIRFFLNKIFKGNDFSPNFATQKFQ